WQHVSRTPVGVLPSDHEGGTNRVEQEGSVEITLSEQETRSLLQQAPRHYQCQVQELLLTALAGALGQWQGSEQVQVMLEGHGREDLGAALDVSRTVGWFTSLYPVNLPTAVAGEEEEGLAQIQTLMEQLPQHGVGYGLLSWLDEGEQAQALRQWGERIQVSFNYLGQFLHRAQGHITPATEDIGSMRNRDDLRPYQLEIVGIIKDGQLSLQWSYNQQSFDRQSIEYVAADYKARLRSLLLPACTDSEITYMSEERERGNSKDSYLVWELQQFLKQLVAADEFSGVALVSRGQTALFRDAYGMADQRLRIPNRVDTKFNLGSLNKMFTSVAIAQLVERGKLVFDDIVGRFLPDLSSEIADAVTIHHLLTHTSGLGDYYDKRFETSKAGLRTIWDRLELFKHDPLRFLPGTQWHYSNAGFVVLGAIIEQVTGQSYFDYIREHIYLPAGMMNTDTYDLHDSVPNMALGYTIDGLSDKPLVRSRKVNTHKLPAKGGPDGGGYSTVDDLLRFCHALRSHVLLSPAMTELLLRGKVQIRGTSGTAYAYGLFESIAESTRLGWIGGSMPGASSRLDLYLEPDYTVVVLSNYDYSAEYVASKVRELLAPSIKDISAMQIAFRSSQENVQTDY